MVDSAQRVDDALPKALEFLNMFCDQHPQKLFAGWRELDDGAAKVAFVGVAADKTGAFRAIDKFNRAVMAKHHSVREVADRSRLARRRCGDYLQQLVLLSLDPVTLGRDLAEAEKLPQLETELRKLPQTRNLDGPVPVGVLFHGDSLHSIAQRVAI
jgi:hypothetical protein